MVWPRTPGKGDVSAVGPSALALGLTSRHQSARSNETSGTSERRAADARRRQEGADATRRIVIEAPLSRQHFERQLTDLCARETFCQPFDPELGGCQPFDCGYMRRFAGDHGDHAEVPRCKIVKSGRPREQL